VRRSNDAPGGAGGLKGGLLGSWSPTHASKGRRMDGAPEVCRISGLRIETREELEFRYKL